jgi:hypothetical protein
MRHTFWDEWATMHELTTLAASGHGRVKCNLNPNTIESDAKIVIDVIWNFEFSILTSHTKSLLFFNFEVKFVKRSFNIVAPILTEIVYSRTNCYLCKLISLHIETILINEMN